MHPDIFRIGPFVLHSYGVLLALSFVLGIALARHRAKNQGMDPNAVLDLSFVIVICAIVGSRFLYVVFHLDEFRGHWLDIINPFTSGQIGLAGLTMLGGVVLSIVGVIVFTKMRGLSLLKMMDILSPSVALGIFLTRIGCFLNGCCFGKPSHLPWALVFPPNSPAGATFPGTPIHPTQLYSSLYGLIIFIILLKIERYKNFDGLLFFSFLMLYSTARFLVDFLRFYEKSMLLFNTITVNQGICILMFLVGSTLCFIMKKSSKSS